MVFAEQVTPSIQVLSGEQIAQVHSYSLKILSEVGIRVDSKNALQFFSSPLASELGVELLQDGKIIFRPESVEWAIEQAPPVISVYNRGGEFAFSLGSDHTHFGIGVTNLFYQEPATDEIIPFSRTHMRTSVGLGNSLPSYDIISTMGIIRDVEPNNADLIAVLEMVAGTRKPLIILISDEDQFTPGLTLLERLVGDLSSKPFVIPYFNPVTPLILNQSTVNNMVSSIERGLPIIFSNYGMAGVSMPITAIGTLALMNAELLAGLVFSQLVKPGTPVILGSMASYFDMKAILDFYDPQTMLLNLACAEMMASYKIPHAGSSGSSDGWGPDLISSQTLMINQLTSCLGKVGLAPFIGGCFASKVFSPALVVYANEIIEQSRQFAKGFNINDENFGFEEIRKIGIGGNFLSSSRTMKFFRNTYLNSNIFPRMTLEKWLESDRSNSWKFLRDRTIDLLNQHNYPDDQVELIKKGERLISGDLLRIH